MQLAEYLGEGVHLITHIPFYELIAASFVILELSCSVETGTPHPSLSASLGWKTSCLLDQVGHQRHSDMTSLRVQRPPLLTADSPAALDSIFMEFDILLCCHLIKAREEAAPSDIFLF